MSSTEVCALQFSLSGCLCSLTMYVLWFLTKDSVDSQKASRRKQSESYIFVENSMPAYLQSHFVGIS